MNYTIVKSCKLLDPSLANESTLSKRLRAAGRFKEVAHEGGGKSWTIDLGEDDAIKEFIRAVGDLKYDLYTVESPGPRKHVSRDPVDRHTRHH